MSGIVPTAWMMVTLIALAAGIAVWRIARRVYRHRAVLCLLQPVAAALLAVALLWPDAAVRELVVLGPGSTRDAIAATVDVTARVALPGAPQADGLAAVPDLATALRMYPELQQVRVVGHGLGADDRVALGRLRVVFVPPDDAPHGVVALDWPAQVQAGAWWTLQGRVNDAHVDAIALLDPSGERVASAAPDADGRFALRGLARAAGTALFTLQASEGDSVRQALPLPLDARPGAAPRVLLLAATPSPDTKYLRRWAVDAGLALEARVDLAPRLPQRRGSPTLDAATLAELDLLIVDERSWAQLANLQDALRAALRDGLGLLVRVTGPVSAATLRQWAELGLDLQFDATVPQDVRLVGAAASDDALHAWLPARSGDALPLIDAADGRALGVWRTFGRGRIGAIWLADSHRLVTRGEGALHATLWSQTVSTLARARSERTASLPQRSMVGERAVLCGVGLAARVVAPDDMQTRLLPDAEGCAAFWPTAQGWHRLVDDAVGSDAAASHAIAQSDAAQPPPRFYVAAPEDYATLRVAEDRAATVALAATDASPLPRPFDADRMRAALLAGWLLISAFGWWLERRTARR